MWLFCWFIFQIVAFSSPTSEVVQNSNMRWVWPMLATFFVWPQPQLLISAMQTQQLICLMLRASDLNWHARVVQFGETFIVHTQRKHIEQLALALKNRVALEFFTVLKYFSLKTEFALKFFKPGGYAYGCSCHGQQSHTSKLFFLMVNRSNKRFFYALEFLDIFSLCLNPLWNWSSHIEKMVTIGPQHFWLCRTIC